MAQQNYLLNKTIIILVIILFIGAVITPIISGHYEKTKIFLFNIATDNLPLNDDYVNSYWKFDECSGNIAGDSSGHNYDGTIYGATWAGEYPDCMLLFDGIDDYVNFSTYSAEIMFNKTDDFIISFIFKSTGKGVIYSSTAPWGFNPEFLIELVSNGSLLFKLIGASHLGITLYSNGIYNDGDWHFVEYYHNGITTSPTVTLYVDNISDNSNSNYYYNIENDEYTKAKMGVNAHSSTDYFDGYIDEFKIIKYEQGNEQEPPIITGPAYGPPGEELEYKFVTDDPEGDKVWILIDWGDGTEEDWRGPYLSGEEVTVSHQWEEEGTYEIKARSKDIWDNSRWSDIFKVIIGYQPFPKICCDPVGLNFGNVSAGSTVTGEIYILNCGDPGSLLNWYVDTTNLPNWGTWTFTPATGEGLSEGDSVTVDITCVVTKTHGTYSGTLSIINSDNIPDKCVVDTSAIVPRTRATYKERAYRFIYIDCGHIGQNFYLVAEALGLNACVVGAYYDDDINEFLDLDEDKEFAIYMGVVGKKR